MKCMHLLLLCGMLCLGSARVGAQTASADPATRAQQNFEREVASCNSGALAAPEREACIRLAGQQLDRARGLPPVDATVTSTDGRATVMQPEGAPPPAGASVTEPSRDGRATVVR